MPRPYVRFFSSPLTTQALLCAYFPHKLNTEVAL